MKLLKGMLKLALPYKGYIISAVIALISITALNLVSPQILRDMINNLSASGGLTLDKIVYYVIILSGAYLLRAFGRFFSNFLAHKAAWTMVPRLRADVYDHLQYMSLGYYSDKQTGQLMSRIVNDTDKFETLIAHAIPDFVSSILTVIAVTIVLLRINPTLTLFTLIPIPFLFVGGFIFTKKIRPVFRRAQAALGDLNANLQDNIVGIKEIQIFNQQPQEFKKISKHAMFYSGLILRALRFSAIFQSTTEFLVSMGTVIVVGLGGLLAVRGDLNAGDIVAFVLYLSLFYTPVQTIARILEDIQNAMAGAVRVFEVLDAESAVKDKPGVRDVGRVKGDIAFDHVTFSYGDELVLNDISFRVKANEMAALVGPTGAGKTTITNLLMRFYQPDKGKITIDGIDVEDISIKSLRKNISVVLQEVFLFNGTIGENIGYSNPDASPEEIISAAKAAQIHDFISALPEGYDTLVGERGFRLSGGQKQRLSIARAILRNSPILILDEATAAVDVQTESEIQAAVAHLVGGRTILVIAHRLSTIKNADDILVIKDTIITERGKHEELVALGGYYHKMSNMNS